MCGDIVNWLKLFLDWQLIGEERSLDVTHRKRDVLLDVVEPAMETIDKSGVIENWDHSFQGAKGALSNATILILISTKEEPEIIMSKLREILEDFEEKTHYDFKVGPPKNMMEYWGEENSEKFAKLRSLSSDLAIESMKGEVEEGSGLGKPRSWHVKENRPGHVWLNQLGFDNLQEAVICQRFSLLRLMQLNEQMEEDFDQIIENQKNLLKNLVKKTKQNWVIADLV